MRKLIIIVFTVIISILTVNAQQKNQNILISAKAEPVIGLTASFNGVGNSTEWYMGIVIDKHFMLTLGGMSLVNYTQSSVDLKSTQVSMDKTTTAKAVFVKGFINIISLAFGESKIIFGPAMAIGSFSFNYDLENNPGWQIKVMPSVEVGSQLSWARVVVVVKYLNYKDAYGQNSGNFFGGVSFTIPFSIEMHKNNFNNY